MSQSFIINLLGGTVWERHPVDTFRRNGHCMPFSTYAQRCGAIVAEGCGRAAWFHVSLWRRLNWTDLHANAQYTHSLSPSLFWRGGIALFVPGHLVKILTADLLLSPAMAINHSRPLPNIYVQLHTLRATCLFWNTNLLCFIWEFAFSLLFYTEKWLLPCLQWCFALLAQS